tara:strand:- start:20 stop:430 length:411 start_codon:yes stop_codon:yes gene_type:complete
MKEAISWDHSLIKKYSSSNHFKLLNQLRNEVIKYPLIKKKNISSNLSSNSKIEPNDNFIDSRTQGLSNSKNLDIYKEKDSTQSTVSFNNSKNFSIYNSINKDTTKDQKEFKLLEGNLNDDSSNSSFKDRLKEIDMK